MPIVSSAEALTTVNGVGLPEEGSLLYSAQVWLLLVPKVDVPNEPPFSVKISLLPAVEHTGFTDGVTLVGVVGGD